MSLVRPDHFAAIVIHPRRIAQSSLVAEKLKDEKIAAAIKNFGIDPKDVEQIVVLLSMDEKHPNYAAIPVMLTRFTHDVDAKEILGKLPAAGPDGPKAIKEIKIGGKTCLDLGAPDAPLIYVPGKNTIVLVFGGGRSAKENLESSRENMEKVLAVTEPKGPMYERLKKASVDNDLFMAVAVDPELVKQIDAAKAGAPPFLSDYLEAAKTVREGTLSLDLSSDTLLKIILESQDAAAADAINGMIEDGKKMLDGGLAALKQSVPKEAKAQFADVFQLGDEALAGLTVTKNGSLVTADLKRPASLDKAGPVVDKVIQLMIWVSAVAGTAKNANAASAH